MRRVAALLTFLAFLTLLAIAPGALAQSWPERPVRFIVPLGAGAGADITARLFAERLGARWGQPVVVENRPGGDGIVGINAVLGARDDHTLLFGPSSNLIGHPYTLDKPAYDLAELVPIARVTSTVVCFAVPTALGANSVREFMTLARERSGKLNWSTVTVASDLIWEGYFKSAGLDLTKISYRDTVSALNDLVESRIHAYGAACAIVRAQAQGGRVKMLAVTNRTRAAGLDLPTVAESGYPQLNFDGLVGVIAARSANLPEAARSRIAADIRAVATDAAIAERMHATAQILVPGDGAEFSASIKDQADRLAESARLLGMKRRY